MNFPHRHWSPLQRRYPSSLQVANTHYMERWVGGLQGHTFVNFHCSFLFKGALHLCVDGVRHLLSAPCAFIIYPSETVDLVIDRSQNEWGQLYFDFEARYVPELERIRLIHKSRRVWSLTNASDLWTLGEELCALSHHFPLEKVVDRVDRLCEHILIESQASLRASDTDLIGRILTKMQREPRQPFNLSETIRLAHMSEATFRRRWEARVGMSPRCYLEQLRMQTACRLLIETDLSVNEIANKVGFEDEFYFSRRFRAVKDISPRAYRNRHER